MRSLRFGFGLDQLFDGLEGCDSGLLSRNHYLCFSLGISLEEAFDFRAQFRITGNPLVSVRWGLARLNWIDNHCFCHHSLPLACD